MAAADLLRTPLPKPWSYAVTREGRVFFIDDERRVTSWIHPVLRVPIQSGLNPRSDLPPGFEEGITPEGIPYYVDHFNQITSSHPPQAEQRTVTISAQDSESRSSTDSKKSGNKKKSGKQRILDKTPSAKRSPNSPVAKRGWLYHQEGSGLKNWKRRWCVLSDFCLFIYKTSEEEKIVESILLPSYQISQCGNKDGVKKEFAFKAEHENVRPYFLAADSQENMASWMKVMGLATVLQRDPSIEEQIRRHKSLTVEDDDGGFSHAPHGMSSPYPDTIPSDMSRYPHPYSKDLGHMDPVPPDLQESYTEPKHKSPRNASHPHQQPNYHDQPHYQTQNQPMREQSYHQPANPLREINHQEPMREQHFDDYREEPHYQNVPILSQKSHGFVPDLNYNDEVHQNNNYSRHQKQPSDDGTDYGKLRRGDANWDIHDISDYDAGQNSRTEDHPISRSPYAEQPITEHGYRERYNDSYTSLENKENVQRSKTDSMQRLHEWKQRIQRLSVSSNTSGSSPRNRPHDRQQGSGTSPRETKPLTVDTSSSPASQFVQFNQNQDSRNRQEPNWKQTSPVRYGSHDHLLSQNQYGSQDRFSLPGRYGSQQLNDSLAQNPAHNGSTPPGGYHQNLDGLSPAPERPPLPAAYREQIAMDLASTKTPVSKQDMLLGVAGSLERQSEPLYFQFPQSPPLSESKSPDQPVSPHQYNDTSRTIQQREPAYPASYHRAKQQAEMQQHHAAARELQHYPQSYLQAKHQNELQSRKAQSGGHNGYPESYWRAVNNSNANTGDQRDSYDRSPEGFRPFEQGQGDSVMKHLPNNQPIERKSSPNPNPYQSTGNYGTPWTNPLPQKHSIFTVKEDPNMSETDILATKTFLNLQKTLNGHLRLSISAGDLIGKSHEELVLLLIQLRRQQAMLETTQAQCKRRLDDLRDNEKTYRRVRHNSVGALPESLEGEHAYYTELVAENNELLKKLEVFKPLVNLVDNLVTMGSLYGGDNLMLASQFKQHKLRPGQYTPPKKLVEFSRHLQEQKLAASHQVELQQLTEEEMDFEEKLQKLIELDRTLQDHSVAVASLQDDKDLIEKALAGLSEEFDQSQREGKVRHCDRLLQQQKNMEREMSKVKHHLAEQSRILEETATENARVEHEVMLLRKRVSGHLNRSISSPTLSSESANAKSRLERELTSIQSIMDGLNQQGAKLSEVMSTLRRSNPDLTEDTPVKATTYVETDMDTMESVDIADRRSPRVPAYSSPPGRSTSTHQRVPSSSLSPAGGYQHAPPTSAALGGSMGSRSSLVRSSPQVNLPLSGQPLTYQHAADTQLSPRELYSQQHSPDQWPSTDLSLASESEAYSPLDISEADENTKRFYGLIPKEKPKNQTVRDIKKRENERRSRDRDRKRPPTEVEEDKQASYAANSAGPVLPAVRRSQSLPRNLSKTDQPIRKSASPNSVNQKPLVRATYERQSDRTSERKPKSSSSSQLRASTSRLPKKRTSHISSKSALERLYPQRSPGNQSDNISLRSDSALFSHNASPYDSSRKIRESADGQNSPDTNNGNNINNRIKDLLNSEVTPMMTSSPQSTLLRSKASESSGNLRTSPNMQQQSFGSHSSLPSSYSKFHQGAPVGTVHPVPSSQESYLVRAQPAMVTSNVSYDIRDYDDIMSGRSPSHHTSSVYTERTTPLHSRENSYASYNANNSIREKSSLHGHDQNQSRLVSRDNLLTSSSHGSTSRIDTTSSQLSITAQDTPSLPGSASVPQSPPSAHISPRRRSHTEARKASRARFQTVSSSQPVTLEQLTGQKAKVQSSAGDLIMPQSQDDISADDRLANFDEQTIDREILFLPDKVEIPERYTPDSDDDMDVSHEEQMERQKKADRIKKMLATHSLQEFSSEELHSRRGHLHQALEDEKKERIHVLDIRQALALEAKSKTRELAAQRRKSELQETPGRHVEGAEDDGYNTMHSIADLNSFYT